MYLHDLKTIQATHQVTQEDSIAWLSKAWARKQGKSEPDLQKVFSRVACRPEQIQSRSFFLSEINSDEVHWKILKLDKDKGHEARNDFFSKTTNHVFNHAYEDRTAPDHLIHVTCTGYSSPSPAQKISSNKWQGKTQVLHAYHMGCYAAVPAIRMAQGLTGSVDIFHTELCTLHLNLFEESLEQMVIQSLFADGVAVYRLSAKAPTEGFKIVDARERILPDTQDAMTWVCADFGMKMSLSKDVPRYIGSHLHQFLTDWKKDLKIDALSKETIFAIHPGGPKIIDFAQEVLSLSDHQVKASRDVLFHHGNMSSATLPHIWDLVLKDPKVASGTDVVSFAFGPGLTVAAVWMKKI